MELPARIQQPWLLPGVLGVFLISLLTTSGVLWGQARVTWDDGGVAVAKEEADNLFTLDHRTAEDDYNRVLGLATGTFKKEYGTQRDEVVDGAKEQRLVSTATVPDGGAAVEYLTENQSRVLVAVDVTTDADGMRTQQKRIRLRVTLHLVDDAWLVSGIEEVR